VSGDPEIPGGHKTWFIQTHAPGSLAPGRDNMQMANMERNAMKFAIVLALLISLAALSCGSSIPKGATAVSPFEKEKYLGKWYEIARLDFKYERNLSHTTAEYSLNKNGTIRVDNRGVDITSGKKKQAIGKAKFVGAEDVAMLKVSFFGPFYGGYNVIALDPEYRYSLVAGSSLKYLWILSRETTIPDDIKNKYLDIANRIGFKTAELIWVEQK